MDSSQLITHTSEPSNIESKPDYLGYGNLIITLLLGILTIAVTWKVALKTLKKYKLSYSIKTYPILSSIVSPGQNDLKIQYNNDYLEEPWLISIDIQNIGDIAIENPPINISKSSDDEVKIIAGYFENIPDGYSDIWEIKKNENETWSIHLDHINPNQTAQIKFYIDKKPTSEIKLNCAMPNLTIQKKANTYEQKYENKFLGNSFFRNRMNIILLFLLITLLLFPNFLYFSIHWLTDTLNFSVSDQQAIPYTVVLILLILFMNFIKPKFISSLTTKYPRPTFITSIIILSISILALGLILYNLVFSYKFHDAIAISTLFLIATSVHIISSSIYD